MRLKLKKIKSSNVRLADVIALLIIITIVFVHSLHKRFVLALNASQNFFFEFVGSPIVFFRPHREPVRRLKFFTRPASATHSRALA